MPNLKIQSHRNFLNGRIGNISNSLLPPGSVTTAKNMHFDKLGLAKLRSGTTLIGSQISNNYTCLGLYYLQGSNSQLLAVFSDGTNNDVYYNNAGTWTKITGLTDQTKDLKTRFTTFLDQVIVVNGTDIAEAWFGTGTADQSIGTSANDLNLDDMDSYKCNLIESFKARVYMAGNSTNPDRLFFSKVVSTTPHITWAPTTDYVDVGANDGSNITALKKYAYDLLVFKTKFLYRYRGSAGVDPEPLINIGTPSQEAVVEGKKGVYYFSSDPVGIYVYTGGQPVEISRAVSDFLEAIPSTYFTTVNGFTEADGDHINFNIGDVTVSGVAWVNVVLRYTISSQVWTVYSYPNELRRGVIWDNATNNVAVVGDSDGNVMTFNSGLTDNGTNIEYDLITRYYELGALSESNAINKLSGICEDAQGSALSFQIDDKEKWNPMGQLRNYVTIFKNTNIKGHRVRFKLFGTSSVASFTFEGLEIIDSINKGFQE